VSGESQISDTLSTIMHESYRGLNGSIQNSVVGEPEEIKENSAVEHKTTN